MATLYAGSREKKGHNQGHFKEKKIRNMKEDWLMLWGGQKEERRDDLTRPRKDFSIDVEQSSKEGTEKKSREKGVPGEPKEERRNSKEKKNKG